MLYWLMKYVLVGPWLRLIYRPDVEGLENIPDDGPAILASNHLSFSDSIFLPLMVSRPITFLAKSDYFTGRSPKGRLIAWFFRSVGQVPVDRSGGRASEAAIATGVRVLGQGLLLGIYPEGTRSPDGKLYRGRTGMARMALEARVPVIPVAMVDTEKIQPPGKVIPRIGRIGSASGRRWTSPATRVWRTTGSSSARSPTSSCTSSWSFPARSTSTCTRRGPKSCCPDLASTRPVPRVMATTRSTTPSRPPLPPDASPLRAARSRAVPLAPCKSPRPPKGSVSGESAA